MKNRGKRMAEQIIPCETCITKAVCWNKTAVNCKFIYYWLLSYQKHSLNGEENSQIYKKVNYRRHTTVYLRYNNGQMPDFIKYMQVHTFKKHKGILMYTGTIKDIIKWNSLVKSV
jgi:hypothetical protein